MANSFNLALDALKKARRIALFCHIRPDGDALGGMLALRLALKNAGKAVDAYCEEKPAEKFAFLPTMDEVKTSMLSCEYDLLVSVDCADISRLGIFAASFSRFNGTTLNIDHHFSNSGYAKINYVFDCPASCQILTDMLLKGGYAVDKDIADLLMAGLITDSGCFMHSDVTDATFTCAAFLKKCGADMSKINYELNVRQSRNRAELYGKVLKSLRYELDGKFAYLVITQSDLNEASADKSLTDGFVDFPLSVDGVEVAAAIMEFKENQYKVSLRSRGKVNVNAIAATFGGGGHVLASGCMLFGSLPEVLERLTYAVYQNI